MLELIKQYLESMKSYWSPNTARSEKYRLTQLASILDSRDPRKLWEELENRKLAPYTRNTVWTRVSSFYDWLITEGHVDPAEGNPYSTFRRRFGFMFRNNYTRRPAHLSFDEAIKAIRQMKHKAAQRKALELLYAGLRYEESLTLKEGMVTGKGKKVRQAYVPKIPGPEFKGTYQSFWRILKKEAGLKPHDLRKIGLTRISNLLDNNPYDLVEVAGWSDISTAMSYVPGRKKRIEKVLKEKNEEE